MDNANAVGNVNNKVTAIRKIGILNGGGDCAGLNAVIASVVKAAHERNIETVGVIKGLEGLLTPMTTIPLNLKAVAEITGTGGTILHTTNKGRFTGKVGAGDSQAIDPDILNEAKSNLSNAGIDALIVIGGDGTLSSAQQLVKLGVNIVAVPKTIDNDLKATDVTFGFSTAVDTIVEALDKLRTTADSHNRVFFVEVMGRHTGWLALYSGFAGEADIILIPEVPFDYEKIISKLRKERVMGKNYSLIVVAEGAQVETGKVYQTQESGKENLLGGVSDHIMNQITKQTGEEFEMRTVVLGHTQRGGAPNADDRILAQQFGVAAFQAVLEGNFGKMVRLDGTKVDLVSLAEAVAELKVVSPDDQIVAKARALGIEFGD